MITALSHTTIWVLDEDEALVAKGALGAIAFETDDCRATYEELSGRGVTFLSEPTERFTASRRRSATTRGTGSA